MFKPLRMVIAGIAGLTAVGIISLTFGAAYESLRQQFISLVPSLKLSSGWATISLTSATNMGMLFDAIVPICIAIVVYIFLGVFTNTQYEQTYMG